jgi:hypothetical protein
MCKVLSLTNEIKRFGYIIELEDAVKNGLNFSVFPHSTNSVKQFTNVETIPLEVQQIAQVETTDALVVLV